MTDEPAIPEEPAKPLPKACNDHQRHRRWWHRTGDRCEHCGGYPENPRS